MSLLFDRMVQGKNFTAAHVGKWEELSQYKMTSPFKVRGKVFLKEELQCSGMEVSLNVFPAGVSMPFHHKHKENEELYIFVKGEGQFQIDGETFDVREGTVIRVATEGVRTWRNHSNENIYFICIQAKANSLVTGIAEDGVVIDQPVKWPEDEKS
jgi:mannose-6-phosphate isomerase-like protein (cupin superfamily)